VYGNLTDGEAGVVPCIEIQKWNGSQMVFLIADHVIKNTAPTVYVDDVETPSGWSFSASNDFESQGLVAILTFSDDVSGKQVSVKCEGKENGAGALIENLAEIIYDLTFVAHNLDVEEWNNPKYIEASQLCAQLGYVGGGVIKDDRKLVDHAHEILTPIGGAYIDRDKRLTLYVENIETGTLSQEYYEDHEIESFSITKKLEALANEITIKARNNWRKERFLSQEETFDYELTDGDAQSQLESKVRHRDIETPWLRSEAAVASAMSVLLSLWAKPRWRVRLVLNGFRAMMHKPGQTVGFTRRKFPAPGQQQMRVQQITVGWSKPNGNVTLSGFHVT
jgi:hypothetical protein